MDPSLLKSKQATSTLEYDSSGSSSPRCISSSSSIELESGDRETLELDLFDIIDNHPRCGLHARWENLSHIGYYVLLASRRAPQRITNWWLSASPKISSRYHTPSPLATVAQTARAWSYPLLPSFLQRTETLTKSERISSTSYLNGVRGIACYVVYTSHVQWNLGFQEIFDQPDHTPVLGALLQGSSMVAIFFIVSGFSISYRATSQIRAGDLAGATDSLASSAFRRRWPRLYLPTFAITLVEALLAYIGFEGHEMIFFSPSPRVGSFWGQMAHVCRDLLIFGNPIQGALGRIMDPRPHTQYDGNTWTIPLEYLGSMVVFMTIMATMKLKSKVKLALIALLAITAFCYYLLDVYLFLVGLLLAEIHCLRQAHHSILREENMALHDESKTSSRQSRSSVVWGSYCVAQLIIALYLVSVPFNLDPGARSKGFETVARWIPNKWSAQGLGERFTTAIAATYLMVVLETAPFLQVVFTSRLGQYLGRISFCLYLVLSTLYKTLGWWFHNTLLANVENLVFKAFFSYILLTVFIVWTADLATRFIDEKAVILARRIYVRLC